MLETLVGIFDGLTYNKQVLSSRMPIEDGKVRDYESWLDNELGNHGLKHYYSGAIQFRRVTMFSHEIYTENKKWSLFGFKKTQRTKIAEITSEPAWTKSVRYLIFLKYDGFKIKLLNLAYSEQIDNLCQSYTKRFNEPVEIITSS